jgi:hypothetical protein
MVRWWLGDLPSRGADHASAQITGSVRDPVILA